MAVGQNLEPQTLVTMSRSLFCSFSGGQPGCPGFDPQPYRSAERKPSSHKSPSTSCCIVRISLPSRLPMPFRNRLRRSHQRETNRRGIVHPAATVDASQLVVPLRSTRPTRKEKRSTPHTRRKQTNRSIRSINKSQLEKRSERLQERPNNRLVDDPVRLSTTCHAPRHTTGSRRSPAIARRQTPDACALSVELCLCWPSGKPISPKVNAERIQQYPAYSSMLSIEILPAPFFKLFSKEFSVCQGFHEGCPASNNPMVARTSSYKVDQSNFPSCSFIFHFSSLCCFHLYSYTSLPSLDLHSKNSPTLRYHPRPR